MKVSEQFEYDIVIMGAVAGLLVGILIAFVRNIETNNIKNEM